MTWEPSNAQIEAVVKALSPKDSHANTAMRILAAVGPLVAADAMIDHLKRCHTIDVDDARIRAETLREAADAAHKAASQPDSAPSDGLTSRRLVWDQVARWLRARAAAEVGE